MVRVSRCRRRGKSARLQAGGGGDEAAQPAAQHTCPACCADMPRCVRDAAGESWRAVATLVAYGSVQVASALGGGTL